MRRLFAIAVLVAATAHAQDDDTRVLPPERCDDLLATCKDGCSLDYGSSVTTRDKLATCLVRCDERRDLCLLRNVAKRKVEPPPSAAPAEKKSAPAPKAEEAAPYTLPPTRYTGPEPPAAPKKPAGGEEEEAAPVRRESTKLAPEPPEPGKKAPPKKKGDR